MAKIMKVKAPSLFKLACDQQRTDAATSAAARLRDATAGQGSAQAVLAFLGTKGKSSDIPTIASLRKESETVAKPENLLGGRARRYKMLRQSAYLLQDEAVNGCCHRMADMNQIGEVQVVYREATKGVGFRGVQTCGSVWHCPVCANKIAETRRAELATGMALHQAMGGKVYMMTLTFPHTIAMDLRECIEGQRKALKLFKESAAFKRFRKVSGYKGGVRALEVTHGENGWHPHTHELLFCNSHEEYVLNELEALRDYWGKAVKKAGLGQINAHGFDVAGADAAADYVTKFGNIENQTQNAWTVSHEMTRQHMKVARKKGRTPFALLFDSMQGDSKAARLFIEYAKEFKGKRQLYYSPGLKDYLGLEEVLDAEIAAQDEQDAEGEAPQKVLYTLTYNEWKLLCRFNMRGELLDVAANHGTEGIYLFIKALKLRDSGKALTAEVLIDPATKF